MTATDILVVASMSVRRRAAGARIAPALFLISRSKGLRPLKGQANSDLLRSGANVQSAKRASTPTSIQMFEFDLLTTYFNLVQLVRAVA